MPSPSFGRRRFNALAGGLLAAAALPRPLSSSVARVRHAHHTPQGRAMLALYARAVDIMKKGRPDHDPLSWSWQARIHWTESAKPQLIQQLLAGASPDVRLLADLTWSTCRAHNAFANQPRHFLPWHRAYLGVFERIVRRVLAEAGEPGAEDFALPYWDYLATGRTAMPPEFRPAPAPPNGALHHAGRRPEADGGTPLIAADEAASPLREGRFSDFSSKLDNNPHGVLHTRIGGDMGMIATAARDPIFWLHHAAIDRMWEMWLALGAGRRNPDDPAWLDAVFTFAEPGAGGLPQRIDIATKDAAQAATFGYVYDALDPPPSARQGVRGPSDRPPLAGRSVVLPVRRNEGRARLPLPEVPAAEAMSLWAQSAVGPRVQVVLDDLASNDPNATPFTVFLGGGGAEPVAIGTVAFFDARPLDAPPLEPLTRFASFDVTEQVADLLDRFGPELFGSAPEITLVPEFPDAPAASAVVGRAFFLID